jgi:hypothetical protein
MIREELVSKVEHILNKTNYWPVRTDDGEF